MSIRKNVEEKMYSKLFRSAIFPVMELSQGTKIQNYLKWLEKTQWWKPEQLDELQNKKLKALIKHAYENVPYYHDLFRKLSLKPEDIKKKEDLQKLPILTKEDIRRNCSELLAKDFKRWKPLLNATSGSTGEPLKYYITKDNISIGWASGFRAWGWAEYELGDKYAMLGGPSLVPQDVPLKKRIRYIFERVLPLTSLNMTEEKMAQYARKLKEFKPKFIRGYPSALFIFAMYLNENNIYDIRPKAVLTTSETLLPYQRKVIEDIFGCEVFNGYGCRDGNANAMECAEHNGYHTASEQVIMEFLRRGENVSPGEMGEIIATDLHNFAMPFIRYAVGDVGVPTDEVCSCGRGLPLLKSVEGRVLDIITLEDGTMLSGEALIMSITNLQVAESVKQYQIIQESENKLVVKIVRGENHTQKDTESILNMLRRHVGDDMDIKIEFVEDIPTTKAGKRQYVISKVTKKGHKEAFFSGC